MIRRSSCARLRTRIASGSGPRTTKKSPDCDSRFSSLGSIELQAKDVLRRRAARRWLLGCGTGSLSRAYTASESSPNPVRKLDGDRRARRSDAEGWGSDAEELFTDGLVGHQGQEDGY